MRPTSRPTSRPASQPASRHTRRSNDAARPSGRRFERALAFIALVTLGAAGGCGGGGAEETATAAPARPTDGPLVVYVVNHPLESMARRIGGDLVDVRFPAPADEDPAFWSPDPDTVAAFQEADVILLNGADYAKWTSWATLPESALVDTSAGFADALIEVEETGTHSHGPAGEHSHAGVAFTTWIDFSQAAEQARAVRDALAARLDAPEEVAVLDDNLDRLTQELMVLDDRMLAVGDLAGDRPIVTSHPVYQYLARRYGLNQRAVMWEPEVVPDAAALAELDALLAAHPAELMIWEDTPDPRSVALFEERGVRSVVFAPVGAAPEDDDYLPVMRANVDRLEAALR